MSKHASVSSEDLDELFPVERPSTNGHTPVETVEVKNEYISTQERGYIAAHPNIVELLDSALPEGVTKFRDGFGIDPKTGKKKQLEYLEWHYVVAQLNRIFGYGQWSTRVEKLEFLGGTGTTPPAAVAVTLALDIDLPVVNPGGIAYRDSATYTNVGYATNTPRGGQLTWDGLEMAVKGAQSDAIKRAATALGEQFGLGLYVKEEAAKADVSSAKFTVTETPAVASAGTPGGTNYTYTGQESFACEDCGKAIRGYTSKAGKVYTTQQLWDWSIKQTGGLYCLDHKNNHTK